MLKEVGRIVSDLRAVPIAISLAAVLATASQPQSAAAQGALSSPEAAAIATDAYVYLYPLISMDSRGSNPRTSKQGKSSAKVR